MLNHELERIVSSIDKQGVRKIILFGSLARGETGRASDIDLAVVKETDKRFLDRLDEVYAQVMPRTALDLLVYTPEEVEDMMGWSSFMRRLMREGKVLYAAG